MPSRGVGRIIRALPWLVGNWNFPMHENGVKMGCSGLGVDWRLQLLLLRHRKWPWRLGRERKLGKIAWWRPRRWRWQNALNSVSETTSSQKITGTKAESPKSISLEFSPRYTSMWDESCPSSNLIEGLALSTFYMKSISSERTTSLEVPRHSIWMRIWWTWTWGPSSGSTTGVA